MKQSCADAERTRASVLDAALTLFALRSVRATSLEEVASKAGVTRGAVYWYFPDKTALLSQLLLGLVWPLDIGADLKAYEARPHTMQLLRRCLWQHMKQCMQDAYQWRLMQILLGQDALGYLPDELAQSIRMTGNLAVHRIARVLQIVHQRGQLRPGLRPLQGARCLHDVGIGVLTDCARSHGATHKAPSPLSLTLVIRGACADSMTCIGSCWAAPATRSTTGSNSSTAIGA